MFILTQKESGGVHAVKDKTNTKTVQVFEEEDDALRFLTLLEANAKETDLKWEVMDVDVDIIAMNCDNYGYNYAIIKPDELMIPTID
jgi:hypothetical protein|tara:strand:+ start:209 stop:469 length:261 start_codon:yes stop_codon:yes gene_type:complete